MKKLLVFAIGLGIVLGTVSFAQDTTDTTKSTKKKGKKKSPTRPPITAKSNSFCGLAIPEMGWPAQMFQKCPGSLPTFPFSILLFRFVSQYLFLD